jgi:hypothetical protein
VPVEIDNWPGLSAIAYRIGTFASFRDAMLNKIAAAPELTGLRTRLTDDYSITILALWAAVADIVTFYQERIANEGYLRTATLRDSVLRLVRLIDYQLQPGLAATALLAFTLEPGASVTIPTQLRVQSVPVDNSPPQKYETIEAITADARFNSLPILPAPDPIAPLTPGRAVEFFAPGADMTAFAASLAPGDRLVAYTPSAIEFLTIAGVTVQADQVAVQWAIPPSADLSGAATGTSTASGLFKAGRTFRLFGYDAAASYVTTVLLDDTNPRSLRAQQASTPPLSLDSTGFVLDGRYEGIKPDAALLIAVADTTGRTTTTFATVMTVTEGPAARGPMTGVATRLSATSPSGSFSFPPIAPASAAPSAVSGAMGALTGTYTIQVTFTTAAWESNPGPASAPTVIKGTNIDLKGIPTSPDPNVTGRKVYGFKSGYSSAYQLIDTIDDNSTTVYTITTDQPSWTSPPPSISAVTIHEVIGPQVRLLPATFPSWLSTPDVYLSGRRNGWSTLELGRSIVRGVMQAGLTVGVSDLAPGRKIVVVDANPSTATSATVMATDLVGDQLSFGLAGADVRTIAELGLDQDKAQQITALSSPPLSPASPVQLRNARLEMQVTIGQHPPQTISLAPAITAPGSASLTVVASALQVAVRAALPEVPEFANALAFSAADITPGADCLVVVPGTSGAPVAFTPSGADPDTVVDLGLDGTNVRYLDGVLSGPLGVAAPRTGTLRVSLALLPPQVVTFQTSPDYAATAKSLAGQIVSVLSLAEAPIVLYLPSGGRLLLLPPAARFERPAYLHVALAPAAPMNLASSSAVMLGNVAQASQGETVANEIVGDGDASALFHSFALAKKPVTFLLGSGPHGAQSTLVVDVGGVEWREVATLYGAGPADEVFVTRVADDLTLTMEFGDGVAGARLPTGRANVVATYRQGVGAGTSVGANTLTSLLDKPNGLKRATNPLPADGGAEPQTLENARANAPATVRTFGRAVSLQDFEDVALQTGEIAKATATWAWSGLQKMIFLTVAAQDGDQLSPDGIRKLWAALLPHRDPNHPLLIANFMRVPIVVAATLTVDPLYAAGAVRAAALEALDAALSFDRLQFGKAIHLSYIYAILQGVPGVLAVDVSDLNFKSQDPTFRSAHGADGRKPQPHLFILGPRPGTGPGVTVLPAELASVDVLAQDLVLTTIGGSGA